MEQGRQAQGGWRRQEVANTWRRWRLSRKAQPHKPLPWVGRRWRDQKPQGRRCGKVDWVTGRRGLGKPGALTRQLGAWVVSEEEPKPKRGSWEASDCFLGAWIVKTLKLGSLLINKEAAKSKRGALNQWRR